MRATIATSLLTCLSLLALPSTGKAIAEESASTAISTPGTMTPPVPTTPEAPDATGFDSNSKPDPETQIRIALQLKLEGRPQEALGTLELAIAGNPENARLYAVRGGILLEQGRIAPALSDLEKSVKLDPEDAAALASRAEAYRRFGRVDLALADLDRAIGIQPDLTAARSTRGTLRFGKQDFGGALEDFNHCIVIDPHVPGPYFSRAVVHNALGDRAMATNDLERYLQIEQNADFRNQAQAILDLWQHPKKAKNRDEEVQPDPRP